jgi:hypothetical protein
MGSVYEGSIALRRPALAKRQVEIRPKDFV